MKRVFVVFALICSLAMAGQAFGTTILSSPSTLTFLPGESFFVSIDATGVPVPVGSFDLDLLYASNLLLTDVLFGPSFMSQFSFVTEGMSVTGASINGVGISGLSELNTAELLALQPGGNFNLVTLEFFAPTGGVSNFTLANVTLFDTNGSAVPEPATMLLLGSGLAGLAVLRGKTRKA